MFEKCPLGGVLSEEKRKFYEDSIKWLLAYKNDKITFPADTIYFMLLRFKESNMLEEYLSKTNYDVFRIGLERRSSHFLERINSLLYEERKKIMVSWGGYYEVKKFVHTAIALNFIQYEKAAEEIKAVLEKIIDMDASAYLAIEEALENQNNDEKHQETVNAFRKDWEDIKIRNNLPKPVPEQAKPTESLLPAADSFAFFKEAGSRKRVRSEEKKEKKEGISAKRLHLKEENAEGHLPSIPFSQPSGLVDLPSMDLDFSTANSR